MKTAAYRYRARTHRVIDGDTYETEIDLGFRVYTVITIRLRGVDAPEMDTKAGVKAKSYVQTVLFNEQGEPVPLIVETYKDRQTFARWVADVWLPDGMTLAKNLLIAGHAKVLDIR